MAQTAASRPACDIGVASSESGAGPPWPRLAERTGRVAADATAQQSDRPMTIDKTTKTSLVPGQFLQTHCWMQMVQKSRMRTDERIRAASTDN
jgi:hypothetical protein